MRRASLIAIGIAAVAGVWVVSGQFNDTDDESGSVDGVVAENTEGKTDETQPRVRVADSVATEHGRELTLFGRSEAERVVDIRTATSGHVAEIVSDKGSIVEKGAQIVRLQMDDRPAKLKEAEAQVEFREIAYKAALSLAKKKFSAEVTVAGDHAALETAKSSLSAIRLDISRTRIKAPFSGIIDKSFVEVGDYVEPGDIVTTIVDLDPLIVAVEVTERQVSYFQLGHDARVSFANGQLRNGTVTFISRSANEETRTFRIEVEVPNSDNEIPRGITAEVELLADSIMAHLISPAILTLGEEGRLGVKIVDDANTVDFIPITIVAETDEGVWIGGLPHTVRLITIGQEFVRVGQVVDAVQTNDS